ncbi:hypothetical protein Cgig2_029970 [Carnegiea gigantea]|uniref:Uncharacterized protein n=1 Tax=Carnegiea gigantea TaxID=171969 RepID=A0A9Q1GLG0_9CARY|nr:hypothetical protein Cgig2_029970 [Carnegiea gigantea]
MGVMGISLGYHEIKAGAEATVVRGKWSGAKSRRLPQCPSKVVPDILSHLIGVSKVGKKERLPPRWLSSYPPAQAPSPLPIARPLSSPPLALPLPGTELQKFDPRIATPTTQRSPGQLWKFEAPSHLLNHSELIARAQGLKILRKRRWGKGNPVPVPFKVVDNVFSHLPDTKEMRKSHGRNAK